MSEHKKYPADTPLTMGLVIEIYDSNGKKGPADFWRKQIEPPKPEPRKKYPPDTPVTLEMLTDILQNVRADSGRKSPTVEWIYESVKEHIEPPKPQPRHGELWLCLIRASEDKIALWNTPDGWSVYQSGASEPWSTDEIMPLERLIPAEGSDE